MMKPGSNMQLSKKSLAEELAGRLQDQFMSGKFEVGEKLPPEPELMQISGSAAQPCAKRSESCPTWVS